MLLEAILAAAGGAALGGVTGWVLPGGTWVPVLLGTVAGVNGAVSGIREIYDWRRPEGWLAFLLDSTWGLLGTAGSLLIHGVNLFLTDDVYRADCSQRRNRHINFGGARIRKGYAFSLGNVISNADSGRGVLRPRFLDRHETLHIWQSRSFGPLFGLTYLVWAIGGAVVAFVVWLFNRRESLWSLVETACYYDNPFEYWAYRNDGNWPHLSAHPLLRWRRPPEQSAEDAAARREDRADTCAPVR